MSLGSLFLPVAAVAAVWLPAIARHTRGALLSALDAPHMLAARARGIGHARLLLVHALREALNPLTSVVGVSVAALLSASLPVEVVMSWPGIGQLTFDAVLKRDIFSIVERGTFRGPDGDVDAVARRIDQVPWWTFAFARYDPSSMSRA